MVLFSQKLILLIIYRSDLKNFQAVLYSFNSENSDYVY